MHSITDKLILTILITLLIASCSNGNSDDNVSEIKSDIIEENPLDLYDSELNNEWIKKNTPKKNNNLLHFQYKLGNHDDFIKYRDILLSPYEKNEKKIKHSEMEIIEYKDSIVISFWQNRILEGCPINGNLEVNNDTLKLLFEKVCSPHQEITGGEIVTMHHKYTLKPEAMRKIIVTEKRTIN